MERTKDVLGQATSFRELMLPEEIVKSLRSAGFLRPSPVQHAAIPLARIGSDIIVQAKAGTGKTLVFAITAIEAVDVNLPFPQVLIVAPTREIALQATDVLTTISTTSSNQPQIKTATFIGGLPTAEDEIIARRTCHIIVGTPGRLLALLKRGALILNKVRLLVLDEADKLLTDPFKKDVLKLIKAVPAEGRQTLALSATYDSNVLRMLRGMLRQPQHVTMCEETLALEGVKQYYFVLNYSTDVNGSTVENQKEGMIESVAALSIKDGDLEKTKAEENSRFSAIQNMLERITYNQAIIFCSTIAESQSLSTYLTSNNIRAGCLSSGQSQLERIDVLNALRDFRMRVVVSTDVAARGVDLDQVTLVINAEVPSDAATYMHRVGRAGRFGTRGMAVTLVQAVRNDDTNKEEKRDDSSCCSKDLDKLRGYLEELSGGEIEPLPEGQMSSYGIRGPIATSNSSALSTPAASHISSSRRRDVSPATANGNSNSNSSSIDKNSSIKQHEENTGSRGGLLNTCSTLWPDQPQYPTSTTWPMTLREYLQPTGSTTASASNDDDRNTNGFSVPTPALIAAAAAGSAQKDAGKTSPERVSSHYAMVVHSVKNDLAGASKESIQQLELAFQGVVSPKEDNKTESFIQAETNTLTSWASANALLSTPTTSTKESSLPTIKATIHKSESDNTSPRDPSTGDYIPPPLAPSTFQQRHQRQRAPLGSRQADIYKRQIEEELEIEAALEHAAAVESSYQQEDGEYGYVEQEENFQGDGQQHDVVLSATENEAAWRQYWEQHYELYGYYPGAHIDSEVEEQQQGRLAVQQGLNVNMPLEMVQRYQMLEWQDWQRKYQEWQVAFDEWKRINNQ